MEFNKSTTAFLACHWENDVVGSDGAFVPRCRDESPAWKAPDVPPVSSATGIDTNRVDS